MIFQYFSSLFEGRSDIRELTWAEEQDDQSWAKEMRELLLKINEETNKASGVLGKHTVRCYREQYKKILADSEKECPKKLRKKGRLKQSKSRNLLER